jgi:hypothetical protein
VRNALVEAISNAQKEQTAIAGLTRSSDNQTLFFGRFRVKRGMTGF